MVIFIISMLLAQARASLNSAPPSFDVDGKHYVFVDFKSAETEMKVLGPGRGVWARTRIVFQQNEYGHVLFDSRARKLSARINGEAVSVREIVAPGGVTQFKGLAFATRPGTHELVIETRSRRGVKRVPGMGVNYFFKMRDLTDRKMLEQFLPANLEFDQYPFTLNLYLPKLFNSNQTVIANGQVRQIDKRHWMIEYPAHYNSSSFYFHTFPEKRYFRKDFSYQSIISGKRIPVILYSTGLIRMIQWRKFQSGTIKFLKEMETDFGEYPHESVVVFGKGLRGGMEHAGATETSLPALDHEIFHFYFGRGVMPASGNAGFFDEALASWRDYGYQRVPDPPRLKGNLISRSPYARSTDSRSYQYGREFMAHLDFLLRDQGGLKLFLRHFYTKYRFKVFTDQDFILELELWSQKNWEPLFKQVLRVKE